MEEVVLGPGCARYLYRGFTFMPQPTAASRQPGEAMETTPIGEPHARSLGLGLKLALAQGRRLAHIPCRTQFKSGIRPGVGY